MWNYHDVLLKSSFHLKQKRKVIIWAFLRLLLFSLWECLLGCLAPVDGSGVVPTSDQHRVFYKARPLWCGERTWITTIFCNTQWCLQLCEEEKKEVDISDSPLIHLRSYFKREKNEIWCTMCRTFKNQMRFWKTQALHWAGIIFNIKCL